MINKRLKQSLIRAYQNMPTEIYQDDLQWSTEELAGYFLYNCTNDELRHIEFVEVAKECEARQAAWNLIKKVIYPITHVLRS